MYKLTLSQFKINLTFRDKGFQWEYKKLGIGIPRGTGTTV